MCGICGFASFTRPVPEPPVLERMVKSIHHRGPDEHGVWRNEHAGLASARLRIIDLTVLGKQPMSALDGAVQMVYNGETYNFCELRSELEQSGVRFRSRTDTEVVLHLYLQSGDAAFRRLRGMFALAIWDARTRELRVVRDQLGIKPLYYARVADTLVFGSEIKTLLASGLPFERRIDRQALHEYLYYGNALGERTCFAEIRRLLPGHQMTFSERGLDIRPYWSLDSVAPSHPSEAEATTRVRDLLDKSVAAHLVSDVPVGVFLSGGIDSSAIAAFAARHAPGQLRTYTAGFDFDRGVNELAQARATAAALGAEHHEVHITAPALPDVLQQLVRSHDEPFGDAADIPLFLLSQQLHGTPRVILQGDGGDEVFGGYRRYKVMGWGGAAVAAGRVAIPLVGLVPGGARRARFGRFVRALGTADAAVRMALLLTTESPVHPPTAVLSSDWRSRLDSTDPFARYRELAARFASQDPIQRMLYTDLHVILPDTYLEKVDKATMAHSIEARVPMLDLDLVEYVAALPSHYKVRGNETKWILRRAVRGVVPDAVLDGPKVGFGVPYGYWVRGPLASFFQDVIEDPAIIATGLFDREALRRFVHVEQNGGAGRSFLLWKTLQLALWLREYRPSMN